MKFLDLFENDDYSDVPASVLGQLQGLVKREPNPAAQKKALQGHVDRYRANQKKTAFEKRKEDSQQLSASIQQRRERVTGNEVSQPEPQKPSSGLDLSGNKGAPMRKPEEPNPQKPGKPSMDDLLADLRGEEKEPITSIDQIKKNRHTHTSRSVMARQNARCLRGGEGIQY